MILSNMTKTSNIKLGTYVPNTSHMARYLKLSLFENFNRKYCAVSGFDFIVDGKSYNIGTHISTSSKGSVNGYTDFSNIRVDASLLYSSNGGEYDMRLVLNNPQGVVGGERYLLLAEGSTYYNKSTIVFDFKTPVALEAFSFVAKSSILENGRAVSRFKYELLNNQEEVIYSTTIPELDLNLGERRTIIIGAI